MARADKTMRLRRYVEDVSGGFAVGLVLFARFRESGWGLEVRGLKGTIGLEVEFFDDCRGGR